MIESHEMAQQREQMRSRCRKVLSAWYTGVKNAKLYAPGHPSFQVGAQRLVTALAELFQNKVELNVLHIDGLFRIEEELFIEESLTMYDLLNLLEQANINRVLFLAGVSEQEICDLLVYLISIRPKIEGYVPPAPFSSAHVRTYMEARGEEDTYGHSGENTRRKIADSETLLSDWTDRVQSMFEKLIDEQSLSMADLAEPFDQLVDRVHRQASLLSVVVRKAPIVNLNAQHAVNTMIYSVFLGQQLNFDPASLKMLAIAALLHDVGRWLLPADFTTGHELAAEDAELVQIHARDGASFLAGVPGLPMSAIRVALEHHLGFDGQGYPQLPSTHRPDILSQIVGLADFISWATISERQYHRPVNMHKLLRSAIGRAGTQFNPLLVKLLIPLFGLYPTGTKVRIETGELALAVEPNIRNITRPSLAVVKGGTVEYRWISQIDENKTDFSTTIKSTVGEQKDVSQVLVSVPALFDTTI